MPLSRLAMILASKTVTSPPTGLSTMAGLGWLQRALRTLYDAVAVQTPQRDVNPGSKTLTEGYLQTLQTLRDAAAEDPARFAYGALCAPRDLAREDDPPADSVAEVIQQALVGVAADPAFRHSDLAYTVRRATGDTLNGVVVRAADEDRD